MAKVKNTADKLTDRECSTLAEAGLPRWAQTNSLMSIGHEPVLDFLKAMEFIDKASSKYRGLHFTYPVIKNYMAAYDVFVSTARAMVLADYNVAYKYICPIQELSEEGYASGLQSIADGIEKPYVDFIYIVDFHETSSVPYDGAMRRRLEGFLRYIIEDDIGLCTLTANPLDQCNDWWTPQFLKHLDENSIEVPMNFKK